MCIKLRRNYVTIKQYEIFHETFSILNFADVSQEIYVMNNSVRWHENVLYSVPKARKTQCITLQEQTSEVLNAQCWNKHSKGLLWINANKTLTTRFGIMFILNSAILYFWLAAIFSGITFFMKLINDYNNHWC